MNGRKNPAPLDPAEVERIAAAREAAFAEQDFNMVLYRAGELTEDEFREANRRIVWPRYPRSTLGPCPAGCRTEHDPDGSFDDLVQHDVEVAKIPAVSDGHSGHVSYGFCDVLTEGERTAAQVDVAVDDGFTPENARLLAAAILEAARLAAEWNAARSH